LQPQLSICTLLTAPALSRSLDQLTSDASPDAPLTYRYVVSSHQSLIEFSDFVQQHQQTIDCLILEYSPETLQMLKQLHDQAILLPTVFLLTNPSDLDSDPIAQIARLDFDSKAQPPAQKTLELPSPDYTNSAQSLSSAQHSTATSLETGAQPFTPSSTWLIHQQSIVWAQPDQLTQLTQLIDQAIVRFLKLSPQIHETSTAAVPGIPLKGDALMVQQRRLADKLKERLGYLGIYYKRDPKNFFRYMSSREKQALLDELREDYRDILLVYFSDDSLVNSKIDSLVNKAFLADVSVSQIMEIHMELMDSFSKQLKLEGRNEEILLDYRLTLIDIIAHLCEMYRCSIPRKT